MTDSFNPLDIKAIVFDVGGVLALNAPRHFLGELAVREGLDMDDLVAVWGKHFPRLTRGEISENEFWLSFIDELNLPIPSDALLERFRREIRLFLLLDLDFIKYLQALKADITTRRPRSPVLFAILSNNVREWVKELEAQADLAGLFDVMIYSFEEGIAKPDPLLFNKMVMKLDVSPHEVLLVDDKERNLQAARSLGMHGLLFTTPEEFKIALASLHVAKPLEKEES